MNRKQLSLLIVLLIVLGGAGLILERGGDNSFNNPEQGAGQKLLGEAFPVNDVARISIKEGTNELNLVKQDDLWRVRERNNYPANFSEISEFLIKARDLKVVQSEQVGAPKLPYLKLAPPGQGTNSGIVLDFKNKDDKSLKTLTLGKQHVRKPTQQQAAQFGDEGFPDGRYDMFGGNAQNALLIGDPLSNIEAKPEQWLNKDFIKVERPKSIEVDFPAATNSWELVRDTETGDWKLVNAKPEEKLDSTKVPGVSNPFSAPSFNDVLPPNAKPEDSGLDKPITVTIATFDDFIYKIKVGRKSGENYPVLVSVTADFPKDRIPAKDEKPADKDKADKAWKERQKQLEEKLKQAKAFENWTYLVPTWNVDPVLKERKDLLTVEKKEEAKLPRPASGSPAGEELVSQTKSAARAASGAGVSQSKRTGASASAWASRLPTRPRARR